MRTVVDIIKALEGFPPNAPVQVGLVGADGRRVVHHIHAVEVHEHGIILRVDGYTPDRPSKVRTSGTDQAGEAIAVPPPPAVPGGLEGEGEEPEAPGLKA